MFTNVSLIKKRANTENLFKRMGKSCFHIFRDWSDSGSTGECGPDCGRSMGTEGLV